MSNLIDQQLRRNDCGISAVKTVFNVLGVEISRDIIDDQVFVDEEGATLGSMQNFMNEYGFETNYHLLDVNTIDGNEADYKDWFPCITPIRKKNGLHYVVLTGLNNGKFTVLDPSEVRTYKLSVQEFRKLAYYSASYMQFADLEDILTINIREELAKQDISFNRQPERKELIEIFNKLAYFSYIDENFGFKSKEASKGFLKDLLSNQEFKHLPWHFESLNYKKDQIQVRAPILLSVKKTAKAKPVIAGDNSNPYWRLFKSISSIKEMWFIFLSASILVSFVGYIGVFIDQILIDHIIPSHQLGTLNMFAIGVGVFYLIKMVFRIYRKFISIHLSNTLDRYFLSMFDEKMNTFSIRYLQSFKRGDLTERLSDTMRLKSFFVRYFSKILVNVLIATISTVFLFMINWKLSLLVLVVLGMFISLFYIFTPIIERLERKRFARKADFFSKFIEKIDGIQVIKSLGLEAYSSNQIRSGIDELIEISTKAKYVSLTNSIITGMIKNFSMLALIVLLSREMILYNTISLGMIITFLAMASKIFGAFSSLLNYNLSLQEHKVILNRFFDFDENKLDVPLDAQAKEELALAPVRDNSLMQYIRDFEFKSLRLEKVSFSYDNEKFLFKDLNFEINRGEKLWIKGDNGNGKSTLCKIVSMLYEPSEGNVLVNDMNSGLYNKTKLRQKVVFVSGEDLIFNETLLFNISFGRKIDMEKLVDFAKALNFYEFVNSKADQFNYIVHENGRNLSTGQKRKLLMLRALMTEADVIILDEIFNGIDVDSKRKAEFLIDVIEDKTFVIISHMSIDNINFDKIYKIESDGRILNENA